MNLVWFLTIATILSTTLGEFGHYPFGTSSTAISVMDLLLSLTIAVLLVWQIGIKKEILLPPGFKILIAFSALGLIGLILNQDVRGGLYLVRFFIYSLGFLVGFLLVKGRQIKLDHLVKVFVITSIILSIFGFIQIFFFPSLESLVDFGYDPHMNRLVSTFLDPNFIGSFLAINFMLTMYLWLKLKSKNYLMGGAVLLLAIALTFSRSAYLMLAVEVLVFGIFKERKIILGFLTLFIILYLFLPRFSDRINGAFILDKSSAERIESWKKGLTVFSQNPVFGVGFNNLRFTYEKLNLIKVFSENGGHAGAGVDSSIIFILATTGISGFLIYSVWWLVLLRKLVMSQQKKNDNNLFPLIFLCVITGLLINSQFINSLFFPPIMLLIFLLAGAMEGHYE